MNEKRLALLVATIALLVTSFAGRSRVIAYVHRHARRGVLYATRRLHRGRHHVRRKTNSFWEVDVILWRVTCDEMGFNGLRI